MRNILAPFQLPLRGIAIGATAAIALCAAGLSEGSDHLDTPTVIANPSADIGDIYAWTAPDGRHLNLIMDIVGHSFSDKLEYAFHVDSGRAFGRTTSTIAISCRFPTADSVECRAGDIDIARGDPRNPAGVESLYDHFRVFAGLRDDPFFNNVRGTRAAYQTAQAALKAGASVDAAGCPNFDRATSQAILDQWKHTDGGAPKNFLAGWTSSSIVISIDLKIVNRGGKMLAVWGTTSTADRQLNRVGRPLTKNALLGLFAPDDVGDQLKEGWNATTPETSARFIPEIQKGLVLYDAFDGQCGNQLLAEPKAAPSKRYLVLATLLADDRLWVNSTSTVCTQLMAVEFTALAGKKSLKSDCGGRSPNYKAANIWRSLLVDGTNVSVDDGVEHDDHEHSATVFPFLAAPDGKPVSDTASVDYKE
jgi:Domain of unknown function (DUF4331)